MSVAYLAVIEAVAAVEDLTTGCLIGYSVPQVLLKVGQELSSFSANSADAARLTALRYSLLLKMVAADQEKNQAQF